MIRIDFQNQVVILVGADKVEFYAPKDVLTRCSWFFRAALSVNWQEGQENRVELPEEVPDTFSTFLQWAFCGSIILPEIKNPSFEDWTAKFIELYILADKVGATELKNGVIDQLHDYWDEMKMWEMPDDALDKLLPDPCKLRDFYAAHLAYNIDTTQFEDADEYAKFIAVPPSFLVKVMKRWVYEDRDHMYLKANAFYEHDELVDAAKAVSYTHLTLPTKRIV